MLDREAQEIIACLPKERTLYYYFKDRYAFALLHALIGEGMPISQIKSGPFARLLARPRLKALVANLGDGILTPDDLVAAEPVRQQCYRLTLGTWGSDNRREWSRGYHQTSRRGVNLVLQLNFSRSHDRKYERFIENHTDDPFSYFGHPIARDGLNTLAWARLDLNLETGEALIEEIQNDWVRSALRFRQTLEEVLAECDAEGDLYTLQNIGFESYVPYYLRLYVDQVLEPHLKTWDEAMLSAALWFLREELGINTIYYHTFEGGCRMKNLDSDFAPPRSLYTNLPKRFCFEETDRRPSFLLNDCDKTTRSLLSRNDVKFLRAPQMH